MKDNQCKLCNGQGYKSGQTSSVTHIYYEHYHCGKCGHEWSIHVGRTWEEEMELREEERRQAMRIFYKPQREVALENFHEIFVHSSLVAMIPGSTLRMVWEGLNVLVIKIDDYDVYPLKDWKRFWCLDSRLKEHFNFVGHKEIGNDLEIRYLRKKRYFRLDGQDYPGVTLGMFDFDLDEVVNFDRSEIFNV